MKGMKPGIHMNHEADWNKKKGSLDTIEILGGAENNIKTFFCVLALLKCW